MGSLWNRSGTIERYADDLPAPGAKAYFFQGGTLSALTVYQDAAEGESHPVPLLTDVRGRWPDVFVPYSLTGFDVRVTTADDVQLTYTQDIPNPNPVDVTTPPTTDGLQTGMIHAEVTNATKAGFVRLNGRSIGNAVSGATERANADTSNLFSYLWNNLNNNVAPVSGGRGGSAAADFSANKVITLPDARGSVLVGLDDMGSITAGRFAAQTFPIGHSSTTAGSTTGANAKAITVANMPSHSHTGTTSSAGAHSHGGATGGESGHTHSGTTGNNSVDHTHSGTTSSAGGHSHTVTGLAASNQGGAGSSNLLGVSSSALPSSTDGAHTHTITTGTNSVAHTHSFTTGAGTSHNHAISSDGAHTHTLSINTTGGGTSMDGMPNAVLVTWYIKL